MSLWCLAPSPLMLGGNLPDNTNWDLSLLTNDEVLAINQDPFSKQAIRAAKDGNTEVWKAHPLSTRLSATTWSLASREHVRAVVRS
jgi:hypothetical protein